MRLVGSVVQDHQDALARQVRSGTCGQHVGKLVHGDVGGVEEGGSGLVVDVVGFRRADPEAARGPWWEAERVQVDPAASLALQVRYKLGQVERNRYVEFFDDGGVPPCRTCTKHRLPQHASKNHSGREPSAVVAAFAC